MSPDEFNIGKILSVQEVFSAKSGVRGDHISWWFLYLEHMSPDEFNIGKILSVQEVFSAKSGVTILAGDFST